MAWMECAIDRPQAVLPIHTALYAFTRQEAEHGGIDRRVALLTCEDDPEHPVLLLTPEAAKYADRLPGNWRPVDDPDTHHWRMGYSAGVTFRELGLH